MHTWSDKAFKGAVVNQALPTLNEGSFRITYTVPLSINAWKHCEN